MDSDHEIITKGNANEYTLSYRLCNIEDYSQFEWRHQDMKFAVGCFLFIVILSPQSKIKAQSDNYWSWNFNTPSTLLAGSVTGGGAGPSAVYYNPALIDQENISNFSLSANLISFQFFKAVNIAGEGYDAEQSVLKVQPRFISYTLDNENERLGIEVTILTPVSEEIRYSGQYFDSLDIVKRALGDETYSANLNYERKYDDLWIGGGLSYRFSEKFYMGVSGFVSTKSLKYRYTQSPKAYQETDSVEINGLYEPRYIASAWFQEEFNYWYSSIIFKLGAQYRAAGNRFSVGLNLTFPDIPVIGGADVRKELGRSQVFNDQEDRFVTNENVVGFEKNMKVRVKNPFSAALGFQYISENSKSTFSINIEHFHKIDAYSVVKSGFQASWLPGYLSKDISNTDFLSYAYEAAAVTNLAIGFKHIISPSFYFLTGFRTDFTAGIEGNERFISDRFTINHIHLDKYHFTIGPVWRFQRYQIVSGLQYTTGRNKDTYQLVNFTDPVEYNPETDQSLVGTGRTNADAVLHEIALFFGVTIDLVTDI